MNNSSYNAQLYEYCYENTLLLHQTAVNKAAIS